MVGKFLAFLLSLICLSVIPLFVSVEKQGHIADVKQWFRHRTNFVWLLNKIFLPGALNSFAGLISSLINVYSQQDGHWSTTAWITAAVTGGVMLITSVLFGLYNFWLLEKVRRKHSREMGIIAEGEVEEGLKEKVERKAKEPALEPGSVV